MNACAIHDFQPVNRMRAVYRCSVCGGFAYKRGARTGIGSPGQMVMYQCHHVGCPDRVVKLFPSVKYRKTMLPSCELHRPDAQPNPANNAAATTPD